MRCSVPRHMLTAVVAVLGCLRPLMLPHRCPCVLHVPEPSVEETYQILLGLRERYEAHHKLRYTDESLDSAAKYSSQYISDRFLPDKVDLRTPT